MTECKKEYRIEFVLEILPRRLWDGTVRSTFSVRVSLTIGILNDRLESKGIKINKVWWLDVVLSSVAVAVTQTANG